MNLSDLAVLKCNFYRKTQMSLTLCTRLTQLFRWAEVRSFLVRTHTSVLLQYKDDLNFDLNLLSTPGIRYFVYRGRKLVWKLDCIVATLIEYQYEEIYRNQMNRICFFHKNPILGYRISQIIFTHCKCLCELHELKNFIRFTSKNISLHILRILLCSMSISSEKLLLIFH